VIKEANGRSHAMTRLPAHWKRGTSFLLLAAGIAIGHTSDWKSSTTDRTHIREVEEGVRVESRIREDRTWRPRDEKGRWIRIRSGERQKQSVTEQTEWTDTGWRGESGRSADLKSYTDLKAGNTQSMARDLGKTTLEGAETSWKRQAGPSFDERIKGRAGEVRLTSHAGWKAETRSGENGWEARGQIGVETALRATTARLQTGNDHASVSLQGQARLELAALAKGKLGAYIDEKDITLGAEVSAGLYAKGEVKVNFEAHVFGVKTNVNLVASGYAGAVAEGKAVVTLGWNGKVRFVVGIGASLGLGGSVSMECEVDAEALLERWNLKSFDELLVTLKEFQENPYPWLAKWGWQALRKIHEAGFGVVRKWGQEATAIFQEHVVKPIQTARATMQEGVRRGLDLLGRVIRSRTVLPPDSAINTCLAWAEASLSTLPAIGEQLEKSAVPICAPAEMASAEWSDWAGIGEWNWVPFEWPAPFRWPSL